MTPPYVRAIRRRNEADLRNFLFWSAVMIIGLPAFIYWAAEAFVMGPGL